MKPMIQDPTLVIFQGSATNFVINKPFAWNLKAGCVLILTHLWPLLSAHIARIPLPTIDLPA